MIVIKFFTSNSRLWRYTSGVITEGADLKFEFIFKTEDWKAAATKTAVFNYKGKTYEEKLDKYNQCRVPAAAIHDPYFKVSLYGGELHTNTVKIPIEDKSSNSPDLEDDKPVSSGGVNIFDGGAVIFDVTDNPTEDDSNPSDGNGVVDYIVNNNIPFYSGVAGQDNVMVEYKQLDTATANYTDQGFYTTTGSDGKITNAGYQITFDENAENIAQSFSVCSTAKIVTTYQYQPAFNQWLDMGFDGIYWIENGTTTKIVDGKEIVFTTYVYNEELMGDVITTPEYWRFEVEVL